MTHGHDPRAGLDEHAEMLLGKALLGQASAEELAELDGLRSKSTRLSAVMDLLAESEPQFRGTPLGEEMNMTTADLPDYLRPRGLASGLRNWFWIWLVSGVASAAAVLGVVCAGTMMLVPELEPWRLARTTGTSAVAMVVAIIVLGFLRKDAVMARVAEGGAGWERAVAAVQRQERSFFSPTASAVLAALAAVTALLLLAGGAIQGTAGGMLLYVSALTLAGALVIAKRRLLLRGLRGSGGGR